MNHGKTSKRQDTVLFFQWKYTYSSVFGVFFRGAELLAVNADGTSGFFWCFSGEQSYQQ